jgi:hypothetical protein
VAKPTVPLTLAGRSYVLHDGGYDNNHQMDLFFYESKELTMRIHDLSRGEELGQWTSKKDDVDFTVKNVHYTGRFDSENRSIVTGMAYPEQGQPYRWSANDIRSLIPEDQESVITAPYSVH